MTTVETVTIPKKIWDDAVASQPLLKRLLAPSLVIHKETVDQLSFPVKAGAAIAVTVVLYLVLRKYLKV